MTLFIVLAALAVYTRGAVKAAGALCIIGNDICSGGGECRTRCCAPSQNCNVFCDNSTFIPETGYTDITRRRNCNSSGLCDAGVASENLNCNFVCTPETIALDACPSDCSRHSECWRASAEIGLRWCFYDSCQNHTAGTHCASVKPPPACDAEYVFMAPNVTTGAAGRFAGRHWAWTAGLLAAILVFVARGGH